MLRLDVSLIT